MNVISVPTILVVFLVCGLDLAVAQNAHRGDNPDGVWSEEVNGLQARMTLKRSHVTNGTPIIATYLQLRNVSDVINPLSIPLSEELMTFRVVDENGRDLPKASGAYNGPASIGAVDLILPIRGKLSFDYSSTGLGIPGDMAALVCLGPDNSWIIEPNQGDYFLHAVLKAAKPELAESEWAQPWHGRIELPPVKIPLGLESLDPATIKARIKDLGPKMLDKSGRVSERAERELSLIDDPGVIVWYVKAIERSDYGLKARALDRLSRFDGDAALGGLKKGMKTRAGDFGDTASESVAPDLANNIRHFAASALARSPHPNAKSVLMTMWNDPYSGVKITVLHALSKLDTPESLELLKKMSADRDEDVRKEALRYLQLREGGGERRR